MRDIVGTTRRKPPEVREKNMVNCVPCYTESRENLGPDATVRLVEAAFVLDGDSVCAMHLLKAEDYFRAIANRIELDDEQPLPLQLTQDFEDGCTGSSPA